MTGEERIDAVWRDVHDGRVWRAQACRVVEESEDGIVLWMPAGSPAVVPAGGLRIPGRDWTLSEIAASRDSLCLSRRDRAHSLYHFWAENGSFSHWYVNFERPYRRTPLGVDTFDEKLDLIVRPDRSYTWKDEDELALAAAAGLLDPDEVRAEAARVLEEWPFPTGWEDFRPDPSWPLPRLPDGWDAV